ncbi:DUF4231 domain-containing protein [Phyllobacterium ifriqiyense]|uniref:DUF4231 domain-containing protein n=1 Tax=Phyllobacterium ifriqiyense TaxID=314238 RepID=UPI0033997A36
MFWYRKDKTVSKDKYPTVEDFYSDVRSGFREKSNSNKLESQLAFACIICFTLATPLFVTLATDWHFAKLTPAVLSVLAAVATSWLQLRKPQRLWSLYRRAQRLLEKEKADYDYRLNDYEDCAEPEKLLAKKISEVAFWAHEQWEALVPEPDALALDKHKRITGAIDDNSKNS